MNWFTWSLLSAVFAGATAILAKLGVTGVNSHLATAVRTAVVLVFAWMMVFSVASPAEMFGWTRRTWVFLVLSGLATALSWLCYFRALQLGEAAKVAPVDKLSVVFVLIFAGFFLHEPLTVRTAIGALLVAGGAIVLAWG
jgi:transporter family protein